MYGIYTQHDQGLAGVLCGLHQLTSQNSRQIPLLCVPARVLACCGGLVVALTNNDGQCVW